MLKSFFRLLWKKIDVYGQICIWIYILFLFGNHFASGSHHFNVLYLYYSVGLWQSISALVHFMFVQFRPLSQQRKYYQILAAASLVLLGAAFLKRFDIFGLLMLIVFTSPILAVWYTFISYKELKMWQSKTD